MSHCRAELHSAAQSPKGEGALSQPSVSGIWLLHNKFVLNEWRIRGGGVRISTLGHLLGCKHERIAQSKRTRMNGFS